MAQIFPCKRFDWMVADTDASLEAKVIGEILPRAKRSFAALLGPPVAHLIP
jgi:hypothetical protein